MKNYIQQQKELNANDSQANGRTAPRRKDDVCALEIDGRLHPVIDWSRSGLLIAGDTRHYAVGQTHDFTLKFKLHDRIVDIPHRGRIVRKTSQSVAFEFQQLPAEKVLKMQNIMDYQDTRQLLAERIHSTLH